MVVKALVPKGKPWRNSFIERSNRTAKQEVFNQLRFINSEHRRYLLKLWEMEYNYHRTHRGIGNKVPLDIYRRYYNAVSQAVT